MTWRGEVEDGMGWGGLVPTKAERDAKSQAKCPNAGGCHPGFCDYPRCADPSYYGLTIAVQHLNSSPYNLTKAECIELLRTLRDGA